MSKPYTMRHWKYLCKVYPKKQCEICEVLPDQASGKRLVWDHNHNTNIIRGVLCDNCNLWLEQFIFSKQYQITNIIDVFGDNAGNWILKFKDKIEHYLLVDTGIIYSDKQQRRECKNKS